MSSTAYQSEYRAIRRAQGLRKFGVITELLESATQSSDGKHSIRAWAAYQLGLSRVSAAEAEIARMIERSPPPDLSLALYGLSMVATARSASLFERMLDHGEGDIRMAGADGLGQIGETRHVPRLRGALRDPDPSVQQVAASALARIGDAASKREIEALLKATPRWQLRRRSGLRSALRGLKERSPNASARP